MPKFITSRGNQIYYEAYGVEGPAIVLLHGLGSCTRLWDYQVVQLKKYFRVFAIDFPGHGVSQPAASYSISDLVNVTREFLDYKKIHKAHLMGLSLGCAVALSFACQFPHRVSSLILQSPVGGVHPLNAFLGKLKITLLRAYLLFLYGLLKMFGKDKTAHFVNRFGLQTYQCHPRLIAIQKHVDPLAVWQLAHEIAYPPYIQKLDSISSPAMIITGKGDITPRRYFAYIQQNLNAPCSLVRLPSARHIPSLEQPQAYNQCMLAFLSRTSNPGFIPRIPTASRLANASDNVTAMDQNRIFYPSAMQG